MNRRFSFSGISLRTKLVLSYLLVALGAVLILAVVVSFAVQNYFANWQKDQLRLRAENLAQQIGVAYRAAGNWNGVSLHLETYGPVLLVVTDAKGNQLSYLGPHDMPPSDSDQAVFTQALTQALHGQEVQGYINDPGGDDFAGLYISVPLRYNGQSNGNLIGALLMSVPEQNPNGFSPSAFLANVNQAILITGLVVALAVVICSFLMVRRLTRPLTALTQAAEQMKSGNYAQRVEPPKSGDELEHLAVTFNAMADTIEADVTELRHQEQLRRDLLANIAHDLATPLTAIQGFSEAMADDVITDAEARHETAQLIGREVQRLRRLVGEMQQMTSLESGRIQPELAPLDMQALVDETLAVIQPECEQAGISLHNDITSGTPLVLADSDRITQVLLNLLDNARRHTPTGGTITVGARSEGKMLRVSVSDTGTGIEATDLPHIFERFYKADRARTTAANRGSGLGLSIVKAIITAHGGTISAQSEPGKGTCIQFSLPLATSEVAKEELFAAP